MKRLASTILLLVIAFAPSVVQAFAVSPANIELEGQRGDVIENNFTIINPSDTEQTYYLDTVKFVPREDGAGPRFVSPEQDTSGLAQWIDFESEAVRVPSRSQAQVPFKVAVPEDVPSGGYYAAALVSDAPADIVSRNGALIEAKTAILLFLTVTGETEENAQLLDFTLDEQGTVNHYASGYQVRVQNQGNVHVAPVGEIRATDIFGRTVDTVLVNEGQGRILPNTTRSFSGDIGKNVGSGFLKVAQHQLSDFVIGPVTYTLEMQYGAENSKILDEKRVTVFPWQSLVILGGLTVLVIGGFVLARNKNNKRST